MKLKPLYYALMFCSFLTFDSHATFLVFYDHFHKVKNGEEMYDEFNGYSVKDRKEIYVSLARPLTEDLKTYMWGRTAYVDSVEEYNFSDEYMAAIINPYIKSKGRSELQMAGRGIYVAKDVSSSQKYGCDSEYAKDPLDASGLLEITLHKGTPFLDINNFSTIRQLLKLRKKFGMKNLKEIIYDIISIDPPIVIHYSFRGWYIIKTNKNVSAKMIDGRDYDLNFLLKSYKQMKYPRGKRIFIQEIKRRIDVDMKETEQDYMTTEKIHQLVQDTFHIKPKNMTKFLRDSRQMDDISLFRKQNFYAVIKNPGLYYNSELEVVRFDKDSDLDLICNYFGYSRSFRGPEKLTSNLDSKATFKMTPTEFNLSKDSATEIIKELVCWL